MATVRDVVNETESKGGIAIGMLVIGFAIVAYAIYLMLSKVTTVTGSDITSVVTAMTTLLGTLLGTLFGHQAGAQGKASVIKQNGKLIAVIQEAGITEAMMKNHPDLFIP
jgi:hypothetical protein